VQQDQEDQRQGRQDLDDENDDVEHSVQFFPVCGFRLLRTDQQL
jgi:hypothetical protein